MALRAMMRHAPIHPHGHDNRRLLAQTKCHVRQLTAKKGPAVVGWAETGSAGADLRGGSVASILGSAELARLRVAQRCWGGTAGRWRRRSRSRKPNRVRCPGNETSKIQRVR